MPLHIIDCRCALSSKAGLAEKARCDLHRTARVEVGYERTDLDRPSRLQTTVESGLC